MNEFKDEEWRDIPGWENMYQASNLGRIRTTYPNKRYYLKIRKTFKDPGKYERISFKRDGKVFGRYVHRLVMAAFHGDSVLQVNHIDGNGHNNNLENLEYVTPSQNIQHAKSVLNKTFGMNKERNVRSLVVKTLATAGFLQNEIVKITGYAQTTVSRIYRGKSGNNVKALKYKLFRPK